jgi:hypothetical protein
LTDGLFLSLSEHGRARCQHQQTEDQEKHRGRNQMRQPGAEESADHAIDREEKGRFARHGLLSVAEIAASGAGGADDN